MQLNYPYFVMRTEVIVTKFWKRLIFLSCIARDDSHNHLLGGSLVPGIVNLLNMKDCTRRMGMQKTIVKMNLGSLTAITMSPWKSRLEQYPL